MLIMRDSIKSITCIICRDHLAAIRKEAKSRSLKGVILNGIENYADGTVTYIHKSNVAKHVKVGTLHDWANS